MQRFSDASTVHNSFTLFQGALERRGDLGGRHATRRRKGGPLGGTEGAEAVGGGGLTFPQT